MTDSKDTKTAASAKADDSPAIPTGFPPEPPREPDPEPERKPAKKGNVILATQPPMGALTVPPLKEDGEAVIIAADGTEVDEATAARAHEAARLAGFTLRNP